MVIVCLAEDFDGRKAFLDAIADAFPQITSLYYIINAKLNDSISDQTCILYKGDDAIYEEMEGLRFKIGPKSFYQTNTLQAFKLYKVAREYAGLQGNFFAGDMKDVLTPDFISRHGRPDVMIVDPPRAGMHPDVVRVILDAAPQRIVYVSCNPASQARDLAMMAEKYEIAAVQPVDMFPHTQHVENVCKLIRKE